MVKELVALHGGSVRAESTVGIGTTFTVLLPKGTDHLSAEEIVWEQEPGKEHAWQQIDDGRPELAGEEATVDGAKAISPTTAPASNDHSSPGTPKILIVEDNADLRAYLRTHLADAYTVVEAQDGEEGWTQARAHRPSLILSDVMMPRKDGIALLQSVRRDETLRATPVILLTARASETDRLEGLEAQADDYMTKPFSPAELNARVRTLLERQRTLHTHYRAQAKALPPIDPDLDSVDQVFLQNAQHAVADRLSDPAFTVQVLAEALYMSKSKLERRLKALTGYTPAAFVRQMRLERAHVLLDQHAVETVAEAAHAVGFNSVEYFSRLYQTTYGHRPSEHLL